MAANAYVAYIGYTASFDPTGQFTKTLHTDPTNAVADGKERAAAGHLQIKAVLFNGKRHTFSTPTLLPVNTAGKAGHNDHA